MVTKQAIGFKFFYLYFFSHKMFQDVYIDCISDAFKFSYKHVLEWRIFRILTGEDIDDFTDIKFVS